MPVANRIWAALKNESALFFALPKPFDHPFLALSQLFHSFLHLCPCFPKSPYYMAIFWDTAGHTSSKRGLFALSRTVFSDKLRSPGFYVISICSQAAGLNFILFVSNKLLFFSCKLQIIKKNINPYPLKGKIESPIKARLTGCRMVPGQD